MSKFDYTLYEVGGRIRDEILGLQSDDIDYTVVVGEDWMDKDSISVVFPAFVQQIKSEGFDVFLETPDCMTVRAKFPKDHIHSGVADFVLARKDLGFVGDSRKAVCEMGSLEDDLRRRDFTLNAMAKDSDGKIIDLFDGKKHLEWGLLITPVSAAHSLYDDPLRILRAFRFAVTKDLVFSEELEEGVVEFEVSRFKSVSDERIMNEFAKMLKFNTVKSLEAFSRLKDMNEELYKHIFGRNIWFLPTNKKR